MRVEVNPTALNNLGLSLEDLRSVIGAYNANRPKGQLADDRRSWSDIVSLRIVTPGLFARGVLLGER